MNDRLRFGLNYVPSKNWWYSWLDWDEASISDDLHAIASLGFDHVRIHCIWPVFQPNAGCVSSQALDRLAGLMELADGAGLDVCVCALNGWLSGFFRRLSGRRLGGLRRGGLTAGTGENESSHHQQNQ